MLYQHRRHWPHRRDADAMAELVYGPTPEMMAATRCGHERREALCHDELTGRDDPNGYLEEGPGID